VEMRKAHTYPGKMHSGGPSLNRALEMTAISAALTELPGRLAERDISAIVQLWMVSVSL